MKPWIASNAELKSFLDGPSDETRSEVLVTDPASAPSEGVPVGRAIKAALKGRTRSLSMLVGFFGDGAAGETPEDTPLGLIRDEAAEELLFPPDDERETPADQAEFRLLFGALAGDSRGARLGVVAFWWACRWRALDRLAADTWRSALVAAWRAEEHGERPGVDFEQFALRAFFPGEGESPAFVAAPLSESERARYAAWRREVEAAGDATRTAAAVLAAFFVLRRGHIRLQAADGSTGGQRGLFHGKLYVIERATEGDTIAIMGSPNWSTGALFGSGTHANTEVASISRCAGWYWDNETRSASLASRLTQTARRLFSDTSRTRTLASWSQLDEPLPDLDELLKMLATAKRRGDTFTEPEEPSPPARVVSALDPRLEPLVVGLLSLIERTLGLAGQPPPARRFIDEHLARTANMFAGKKIQTAQVDGAIRLVEILRDTPADETSLGGRGAFLADEAGLGKSIVAQLVAFGLILEKLLDPRRSGGPLVTILAPRQLVVSETGAGPDSGQWRRHRQELLEELHRALTAMAAAPGDLPVARVRRALEWVAREQATRTLQARRVRVLSHSTFQRTLRLDGTADDVVWDHAHLAASEVVVIDESHNLRNGGSSRTRLARFLLSLPVPGEDWPISIRRGSEGRRLNQTPPDERYARRVLCLTATPFNNAFEDIVTQIGHFARSQTWLVSHAEATDQLPLDGFESPLLTALSTWAGRSDDEADEPHELRLDAFRKLLEVIAVPKEGRSTSHLRSGRRLDPDPEKEEFDEQTLKAADGGPIYTWPKPYDELKHVVVVVAKVLAQLVDERETAEPPTAAAVADATQRLDALFGRMFVQRSRSRIIKLMRDEDADRQFRTPRLPRLPLPINEEGEDGVARAEVRILDRLFKQLGEEGTDGLSLFAYRLSTLRSGAGTAGSSEQKSSNLLGFQRMQLIKRLQSSRYAFLQTLLRGPLRRSLTELALLEWIADEVKTVQLDAAPEGWRERVRERAQHALGMLVRRTRSEGSWGAMLSLAVRGRAADTDANTLRAWLSGSDADNQTTLALLGARIAKRVEATLGATAAPQQREWLDRAVADLVADETCQLVTDVETCLDWAFRDPLLELSSVIPSLGRATLGLLEADVERSKGNRGLLSALRRHLSSEGLGGDRDHLFDWLKRQLEEPRICGLIGWCLGQAAARAGGGEAARARGGYRTLVFTEYGDTVDHIAVVLQVVSLLAADELAAAKSRSALADLLLRHTRNTIDLVNEHAARVRAEAPDYEPPIAPFAKLFVLPEGPERRRFVLELAERLAQYTGIRTGAGAARLAGCVDETVAEPSENDDADLLDDVAEATDEAVADSAAFEAIVDAFAPWYRIDPLTLVSAAQPDPSACAAALQRLEAAARQPLYTLVSTEVLAEGVNLQECGVVLHFDLPWNPTRLIQRNGRVDRRIQYKYELAHERERILRALIESAGQDWQARTPMAPDLHAPQQVYHLTAVPAEPNLDGPDEAQRERLRDKVESVRRTLFRKLRSIQILFGLSSWPIVLRAEESRAVLSGELEVETPGFRRREELYARRADLLSRLAGDGDAPAAVPEAPVGTIRVSIDQPVLRAAVANRFAGPEPGAAWAHLHEAGVQTWVRGASPGVAVRSGTQWQEGVRAITAWATTFDGDAATLLRWALRVENRHKVDRISTTPALSVAAWHEKHGWLVTKPSLASLPTLALDPSPDHDIRIHPLSPTGAAEELLDEIVLWLMTGRINPDDVALDQSDGPPAAPLPLGRAEATSPGAYFVGNWQCAGRADKAQASTARYYPPASSTDEAPTALNIKLVFQRGAPQ